MVLWQPILETLAYFDKYDYPLTLSEIWFWQSGTNFSKASFLSFLGNKTPFFFLTGRKNIVNIRKKRSIYSQIKLNIAKNLIPRLTQFPFIKAVFITGALAMSNSPVDDDIDIMLITDKSCLWITRILVIFFLRLHGIRRDSHLPEHSSARVSDKICDNLWLDTQHLLFADQKLYVAHELLQAKCIYDSGGVYKKLIIENAWVEKYLPVAYRETLKTLSGFFPDQQPIFILWLINLLLFTIQYLYMRPHLTCEKIGLGYAFFHPASPERSRRTRV